MQITLQQLKEIAKAGYKGCSGYYLAVLDKCTLNGVNDCYGLHNPETKEDILYFESDNTGLIWIDSDGIKFNHLAAIRKMEELGLIEK